MRLRTLRLSLSGALALTMALAWSPCLRGGDRALAARAEPAPAPIPAPAGADSLVKTPGVGQLELEGPPGAVVTLSGRELGALPLPGPVPLTTGEHPLVARCRGYVPFERSLLIQEDGERMRLRLRMTALSRRDAVLYSLSLAGLGQHYVGRPLLGWTLTALEVGGVVAAIGGELAYTNHRSDYLVLYDVYRNAIGEEDLLAKRAAADKAWRDMENAESLRDTGLLVAASAVVVSVLDAWLRFPAVAAGAGPAPVQRSALDAGDDFEGSLAGTAGGAGAASRAAGGGADRAVHVGLTLRF